ncbi:MAG: FAD-dependent oxidoreductase [Elusimicrobia bacterium]|nr:FAD-dependent oxidoreductase [Elusimicrobiota bacterium]
MLAQMTRPGALAAVVSKIVPEGPDARLLRLELPEGTAFEWRPGQFVEVELPGAEIPSRTFSIANPPQDSGAVEILFERKGGLAERLFDLRGGETLQVRGPLGKWAYRDEDRRAVLLASGTGIAPLRSMVSYVLEKGLPNRLDLFYADRTPGRLLFRREFEAAAERGLGLHLSVLGAEGLWEPGQWWDGRKGPLSAAWVRAELGDLGDAAFYMCGGGRQIDALRAGLEAAGASSDAFRVEKWGDY